MFGTPYPLDGWNEYFNSCQRVSRSNIEEMGPRESADDLKRILYFLQYNIFMRNKNFFKFVTNI